MDAYIASMHNNTQFQLVCYAYRGFFQLAPLLDYLTDILQDVVSDDTSTYSDQRLGQLNATYVQSNSSLSPDKYATLRTTQAYLPVGACCKELNLSCFS